MKWMEEYATGVERIDQHHRMIFQSAEDFRTALDAGEGQRTYGMLLDFLELYCRGHFRFEERCMEQYHCPAAKRNLKAHAGFLQALGGYRRRFGEQGYRPADARALVDEVDRWLDGHICRVDVQLKDSVRGAPPGSPGPAG